MVVMVVESVRVAAVVDPVAVPVSVEIRTVTSVASEGAL